MANVVVSLIDYEAADASNLNLLYPMVNIAIDDNYYTSCAADKIVLSLDKNVNYFEIATNSKTIYKYNPGDTFSSAAANNANDMYTKVYDAITKP